MKLKWSGGKRGPDSGIFFNFVFFLLTFELLSSWAVELLSCWGSELLLEDLSIQEEDQRRMVKMKVKMREWKWTLEEIYENGMKWNEMKWNEIWKLKVGGWRLEVEGQRWEVGRKLLSLNLAVARTFIHSLLACSVKAGIHLLFRFCAEVWVWLRSRSWGMELRWNWNWSLAWSWVLGRRKCIYWRKVLKG